ncbi:DMT family transporter [Ruegeria marisrubri]|uniref:DMT family transporter n=1 Tax=Ruegeria marisrubri TaxID=1685379 RepID=UPI000AB4EA34|nr:DMT family transporter [Ruegeria marisrubri]
MDKAAAGRAVETARPDNIRGILWALLATGLFAVVAALAKVAVAEYHVLQILFFRQIVVFLSTLPTIAGSLPESLGTRHPGKHAIRLAGAFIALSTSIWAVAVLPLTTAVTLGFVQVFFVALLSARFLGEPVGRFRLSLIAAGFLGVVIVMQPGAGGFADPYALIPVLGAFGAAMAVISVRQLSQTESTATLLVYQSVFVGLLAALPLPWVWTTPDLAGLLLLVSMGVVATAGQWAGVRALRLGEASVIGNIQYMQLIHAAILGFVLFGEIP